MDFQKLKFKEVVTKDGIQYFINEKIVDEDTYHKLLNDESLYTVPKLPKTSNGENSCDTNESQCMCEECQELFTIISDIKELDTGEAVEALREYLEFIRTEASLETTIHIYSESGSNATKTAAKLEVQLENYRNQNTVEIDIE